MYRWVGPSIRGTRPPQEKHRTLPALEVIELPLCAQTLKWPPWRTTPWSSMPAVGFSDLILTDVKWLCGRATGLLDPE